MGKRVDILLYFDNGEFHALAGIVRGIVGSVGTRSRGSVRRVSINWKAENREECSLPVLLKDGITAEAFSSN